jgi:alkylhydroperoxidase family enzyme
LTDTQIAALHEPGGRRRSDVFGAQELALLRYTDLLTSHPGNIDQVDLDTLAEHFSVEQVVELATVIATANWTNRVNDGLRVPLT